MVTAATEKAMLEKAMRFGVFHYLLKPVTMEKFIEIIEEYKRKKSSLIVGMKSISQLLIVSLALLSKL